MEVRKTVEIAKKYHNFDGKEEIRKTNAEVVFDECVLCAKQVIIRISKEGMENIDKADINWSDVFEGQKDEDGIVNCYECSRPIEEARKKASAQKAINKLMKKPIRSYHCPDYYCWKERFSTKEELESHLRYKHDEVDLVSWVKEIEKEQKTKKALENGERARAWLKARDEANQK